MPSLAFADVATDADNGKSYSGHNYAVTVSAGPEVDWDDVQEAVKETSKVKDYVEVVKAPAHGVAGKAKLTCMSYGCDKTIEVTIGELNHENANLIDKDYTLEEFAAKLVEQKYPGFENEEAAANWVKAQRAGGACYRACKVCPCGDIISSVSKTHSNSSCGDVTCPQCGVVLKGSGNHTFDKDVSAVEIPANCGHGVGHEATCSVCGVRGVKYNNPDTPSATAVHNYGTPVAFADATVKEKSGNNYVYKVKAGYVAVNRTVADEEDVNAVRVPGEVVGFNTENFDFFKSNKVVTAPTCDGTGVDTLACTVCGKVLKDKTSSSASVADVRISTPKAGHDYAETEVAATCDSDAYTLKKCKVCKHEEKAYKANTKLAHNYVVTKTSASCKGGEVYTVECSTCKDCSHAPIVLSATAAAGLTKYAEDADTVTYLCRGFGNDDLSVKDAIQLTYSKKAVGHKYGKKELLRAATCTSNEVWGYKCTECGKLAVHEAGHAIEYKLNTKAAHDFVKTEVAPTCGTAGYSYEQCSSCDGYKLGNGVSAKLTDNCKTVIAPVVKTGAACSFDKWVVTKNATVFEKGVESLVCSVCGADGHENEAIAKLKYAAPAVKAGKKSATVTVKATADAVSYKISYKKAGGSYKTIAAKAGKKTIKKLAKGKKYTFKVIAVNAEGVEVASATKTVKVK